MIRLDVIIPTLEGRLLVSGIIWTMLLTGGRAFSVIFCFIAVTAIAGGAGIIMAREDIEFEARRAQAAVADDCVSGEDFDDMVDALERVHALMLLGDHRSARHEIERTLEAIA